MILSPALSYHLLDGKLYPVSKGNFHFRFQVQSAVDEYPRILRDNFEIDNIEDFLSFLRNEVQVHRPNEEDWLGYWTWTVFGFNEVIEPRPNITLRFFTNDTECEEFVFTLEPLTPEAAYLMKDAYGFKRGWFKLPS